MCAGVRESNSRQFLKITNCDLRNGVDGRAVGELSQTVIASPFGLTNLGRVRSFACMTREKHLAATVPIERQIHLIRGTKVMLDADLAALYGVSTKTFNQAVKRNRERFPEDFILQLTSQEVAALRSQFVTSKVGRGGRRYRPHAFTEQGVAMLSAVLRSTRAIQMSIAIMRAFVRLRELIAAHKDLADRIEKLEANQSQHASIINLLAEEIGAIKALPPPSKRKIGFHRELVEE
jgi:hypothetical protein